MYWAKWNIEWNGWAKSEGNWINWANDSLMLITDKEKWKDKRENESDESKIL